MKNIFLIVVLFISFPVFAQKLGEMAPEELPGEFPPYQFGFDLMFTEGGFGFGTFLRHEIMTDVSAFIDISISEAKGEKEMEYYDYYGQPFVINKKNRVFLIPLNVGLMYRLFSHQLTDNLRPYIIAGIGPTLILTTPYERNGELVEFFNSFKYSHPYYTLGGYFGVGANFGLSRDYVIGVNVRYFYTKLGKGIENETGNFQKEFGGVFLAINLGFMY